MIICTKYGNNPSRTVDSTVRIRFSRSRPNDLENIGQGQRSLHATQPLMLMMICAKYGKNASRIVDFFFKVKPKKLEKICEKLFVANLEIIDLKLKTLQSGQDFQSQGRMTLKI